jgi:hypothetical protein
MGLEAFRKRTYEHDFGTGRRLKPQERNRGLGTLLIGAAGVAVTGAWVLFLFFVVPALMK